LINSISNEKSELDATYQQLVNDVKAFSGPKKPINVQVDLAKLNALEAKIIQNHQKPQ